MTPSLQNVRGVAVNILVLCGAVAAFLALLEIASRLWLPPAPTVQVQSPWNPEAADSTPVEVRVRSTSQAVFVDTGVGLRLRRNVRMTLEHHPLNGRNVEIRTNALGFRGPEIGKKTEQDFRVLVLGDSITLADYAQEEETYPAQIERHLRALSTGPKTITVVNAGMGSVDLRSELLMLTETGLAALPDIVVVGLYLNDAEASFALRAVTYPPWVRWSRLATSVLNRTSYLKTLVQYGLREQGRQDELREFLTDHPSSPAEDWREGAAGFNHEIVQAFGDWGYAWTDEAWDEMAQTLSLMKQVTADHGAELFVALFPVRQQVEARVLRDEPQRRFAEAMRRLGLPHLDLLPALRRRFERDGRRLFFDHCHYRPEGDRLNGRQIAAELAERSKRLRAIGVSADRMPPDDPVEPSPSDVPERLASGMALSVGPTGEVFVADAGDPGTIQRVAADGRFLGALGRVEYSKPEGVAVDSQGRVYVAETWRHRIVRISAEGAVESELPAPPNGFYAPRDLTIGPGDDVFVANTGRSEIVRYDAAGRIVASWGRSGRGDGELQEAVSLVVGDGEVYVADYINARIQVFTLDGRFRRKWPVPQWRDTPPSTHAGVAFHAGRLYASDTIGNAVLIFAATGRLLGRLTSPEIQHPTGLAASNNGTLFIISSDLGTIAAAPLDSRRQVAPPRRFAPASQPFRPST